MSVKISMVLPTFNSREYIEECLDSIQNQDFEDYEIIIVDDCSTDGTKNWLIENGYKFYTNDTNQGFAKTVNKGILLSTGDFIAILDHDIVYEKDYLKKIYHGTKDIGAGRYYYYGNKNRIRALNIKVNPLTGISKVIGRDEIDRGQYDSLTNIDAMGAGGLLIKREIFNKIGLLNESFKHYYIDVEFCKRAKDNGFNLTLTNAKCYHKKDEEVMAKEVRMKFYNDKKLFIKDNMFITALLFFYIKRAIDLIKYRAHEK